MNNERRKEIKKIIDKLYPLIDMEVLVKQTDIIKDIEYVMDQEQDAFDNLPEGFQCSWRGEKMEEAIDWMQDAIDELEDDEPDIDIAIDYLENAML